MTERSRLEELRRRVQADPTSIAFAALAEEYRRAGRYEEAIEVCRTGLTRHPAYISARVTLGRTLLELDRLEEAEAELAAVLKIAPENLAAIRAQAEIHARRSARRPPAPAASEPEPPNAPGTVPFELDLIRAVPSPPASPETDAGPASDARIQPDLSAGDLADPEPASAAVIERTTEPDDGPEPGGPAPGTPEPAIMEAPRVASSGASAEGDAETLGALERFLNGILARRARGIGTRN